MAQVQIIGAWGSDQRAWLFSHIAGSRKSGRYVVLYVPEQYTLQAERDLMTGLQLKGLLNLDVISPTKLKTLVQERAGFSGRQALDETGQALAVHRVLHACESELVYYQRLGHLFGAAARMDQTLAELKEESLTPEALEEMALSARSASQRAKYQDLSRIWRAYDELLADRFDDPVSAWRDMCRRLSSSGLWQEADLYVYGFDTIRPDLRELLLAASDICASISVLLTMTDAASPSGRIFRAQRESAALLSAALEEKGQICYLEYLKPAGNTADSPLRFLEQHLFSDRALVWRGNPAPSLFLYASAHPTAEALRIVTTLLKWRSEGIPWNRMAIALPKGSAGSESLLAALKRHKIPFYYSQRENLNHHGVSRLLSAAMVCASQGYSTEPLMEIACCGFGTLSREEGSALKAYARAWGIERGRWKTPFTRGDDAEAAEALRQRLLAPLDQLHQELRAATSARGSVEAVYRFLQAEDIYHQLRVRRQQLMDEERYAAAIVDRQVWDWMMGLLDQLYALLEDRPVSMKEMAALLAGVMEQATLSALPEEEEGVLVGSIGHMLPGRTEALILPGMNEGVMNVKSDSLLSEAERRSLESQAGRAIGMNQAKMSMMVRSDYARTMSLPEKRLMVSYCLRDESGTALLPGEPVAELRRLFPDLKEEGGLSAGEIPVPPVTPSLALEGLGPLLRDLRAGKRSDLPESWPEALRILARSPASEPLVRQMMARAFRENTPRQISGPTAIRLFHGDRVSISRLECYAACPFQHFLRYGLRLQLPRDFDFTPGDAGNFFHQALQEYVDEAVREPGWPRLAEERVGEMMDSILTKLTAEWAEGPLGKDALGLWQSEEYLRRARRAASVLTRFAGNSDFQVLGTELEFGTPGGMPPMVLRLTDGAEIALQGKIDRLDLYRGPEGDYLRVLDLKSSEKRLDPARMDSGEQLQLMIYLRAALQARKGVLPAGALYFPVQDREVTADSPEEAESERLKKVQLRGVALAEEDVLRAMDRDISPYSLPKVFNQDGTLSKSADWAVPAELVTGLMDAAEKKAAELCERIRGGEIPVSPSVSDQISPCSFCEFRSFCPVRKADERPLPKGVTFNDVGRANAKSPIA